MVFDMRDFQSESLSHDPIHGYIPFTSTMGLPEGEVAEQQIIDHPWLQRLRQIHQLQTAWWVFPTAEHTRFQHVLGAMHLASRAVAALYESLREVCPDVPSRGYVESLMRMAALLHDVGHGPFGHFFDENYLADYGLNHEIVGSEIIRREFAELIRRVRRNPNTPAGRRRNARSRADHVPHYPAEEHFGRAAAMAAVSAEPVQRAVYGRQHGFRAPRRLHVGLQHAGLRSRAAAALQRVHGQGIDDPRAGALGLGAVHLGAGGVVSGDLLSPHGPGDRPGAQELFLDSKRHLFPGNPLEHLGEYQRLTEWSLLMEVARWPESDRPELRELGLRWQQFLRRRLRWKMACEQTMFFAPGEAEQSSVFSNAATFEAAVRRALPRGAERLAVEGGHGPARPSSRRAHPGGRPEFPLRSGNQRIAASTTGSCSAGSRSATAFVAFTRWTTATTPNWPPRLDRLTGRRRNR